MVKKALKVLLPLLLCSSTALGRVYQIEIVKKKERPPTPSQFIIYTVKRGDTLSKILEKFKLPLRLLYEVAKINRIENPNLIYAGQKLKLPVPGQTEVKLKVKGEVKNWGEALSLLRRLGAKVENRGTLFVGDRAIPLSKFPKVTAGGKQFILDVEGKLPKTVKDELKEIGFSVLGGTNLSEVVEALLANNFTQVERNGTLVLGERDVLTYHYDFMGFDKISGLRTVINLTADTPPPLINLLNAYDVVVVQPKWKGPKTKEGYGTLKILKGEGIEKLNALVYLLTKERGTLEKDGLKLPKSKVFVAYDFITPEEKVKMELQGFRVLLLTGNFSEDAQKLLSLLAVANKKVKLLLYEPPDTKGKRSKFEIEGILITTPKKNWFMVDSVDKPEEIPYLRYRGVNLIVY